MEDYQRGLEAPQKEPTLGRKAKAEPAARRWTVMVMGRVGKVRTFKISPRVVLWAAVFLALYLPASVVVVNQWAELRRDRLEQQQRITRLELELEQAERSLFRYRQHVSLLEAYIDGLEVKRMTVEAEEAGDSARGPSQEGAEQPAEPVSGLVDVQEMSITDEERVVTVEFNIVNIEEGDDPLSGYVHIIAQGAGGDGRTWSDVYPRGEIGADGFPNAYRRGHPFIIQRFKPVKGRFEIDPEKGEAESIRVVVYDDSGRLIFDQSYEVEHAS
ncbi:MAG: hypothetical protein ACLFUE_00590 [Desulfobacteraceae bacterium]